MAIVTRLGKGSALTHNELDSNFTMLENGHADTADNATNADKLFGKSDSKAGDRWGVIPHIGTDGAMEVGKYLDFHRTDSDTTDFNPRLEASTTGLLTTGSIAATSFIGDGSQLTGIDTSSVDLSPTHPTRYHYDFGYDGDDIRFKGTGYDIGTYMITVNLLWTTATTYTGNQPVDDGQATFTMHVDQTGSIDVLVHHTSYMLVSTQHTVASFIKIA